MKQLLFVCTGNTCRSPMAQALCEEMIRQAGAEQLIDCSSAGLCAQEGEPANDYAIMAVREIGLDLQDHRARQLTLAMAQEADEIWVMTHSQCHTILRVAPALESKVFVLGNGICDPFGGSLSDYVKSRDDLKREIAQIPMIQEIRRKGNRP